jgi:hypothetical protein
MQKSLVYVHIGDAFPEYLIDSLFQTLLINGSEIDIYIIVNDAKIQAYQNLINEIDFDTYALSINRIQIISIESLSVEDYSIPSDLVTFRNGFWLHTTKRFFIKAFMSKYKKSLVFHIENDVMMYKSFNTIYTTQCAQGNDIWVVKDSPHRVIPSIMFFPNLSSITALTEYIKTVNKREGFKNDMDILGSYDNVYTLPTFPGNGNTMIFDGAAIGQFLGGIDPRNVGKTSSAEDSLSVYKKTRRFENETSEFKANLYKYIVKKVHTGKSNVNVFVLKDNTGFTSIANIHVHSKRLQMFSSINTINYYDIISGDRVINVCDLIFTTPEIYKFHVKSNCRQDKFVVVQNFDNVNLEALEEIITSTGLKTLKIFVYTHILAHFQAYVLPGLPSCVSYILYIGNSDHCFDETYTRLVNDNKIGHIYAQNLNIISDKCTLLPIGIANRMWPHGDISLVYNTMHSVYNKKKTGCMYVNINIGTFPYRRNIRDACIKNGFKSSNSKPYNEYLEELSKFRFCLCARGNGLDTHRFWESLYLGVIPVIINNEYTNSDAFTTNLKDLGVPFVEIRNLSELKPDNFSLDRYRKIISENTSSVFNSNGLRIGDLF